MRVLGIDVSHYEGAIDWRAVAASEVKFSYLKASEGNTQVDPAFETNWKGCADAGLLHGAYHFARPGTAPEAQAAHFASVVGPAAWDELPPVLDLESTGGLSAQACVAWTLAFVREAETRFGRPLIIYTGGLWRRELGNPDVPALASRRLWTARYGADEPVVPRTWAEWTIWQFTDGQSGSARKIPGIRGAVDCNWYRGTLDDLTALAQESAAPALVVPGDIAPTSPSWPGRYLVWPSVPAMRGDDVRAWQAAVQRRYTVTVDGIYGSESKRTCIALQRDAGLEPDGIVGPATWNATFAG